MVTQILGSLTSKPVLFMLPWSPHLWTAPHALFLRHHRNAKVCPGDTQETNGSCKLHGAAPRLVFLTRYRIYPVM